MVFYLLSAYWVRMNVAVIYPDGNVKQVDLPENRRLMSIHDKQHELIMPIEICLLDGVERHFARTQSLISDSMVTATLRSI